MHRHVTHFPRPISLIYCSRNRFPALASRYFCLLLRGLSGMVISINPSSKRIFKAWCLNLVRSERPVTAIRSRIAVSSLHFRRISTWCRLSANLVQIWGGDFGGDCPFTCCAEFWCLDDNSKHIPFDHFRIGTSISLAIAHHLAHSGAELIIP